jgi:hypothetical protein
MERAQDGFEWRLRDVKPMRGQQLGLPMDGKDEID